MCDLSLLSCAKLYERKQALGAQIELARHPSIRDVAWFDDSAELLAECEKRRLEGVVAKRIEAPYRSGPRCGWVKLKTTTRREANAWRGEFFHKRYKAPRWRTSGAEVTAGKFYSARRELSMDRRSADRVPELHPKAQGQVCASKIEGHLWSTLHASLRRRHQRPACHGGVFMWTTVKGLADPARISAYGFGADPPTGADVRSGK